MSMFTKLNNKDLANTAHSDRSAIAGGLEATRKGVANDMSVHLIATEDGS
jgi:hypothetical protein